MCLENDKEKRAGSFREESDEKNKEIKSRLKCNTTGGVKIKNNGVMAADEKTRTKPFRLFTT